MFAIRVSILMNIECNELLDATITLKIIAKEIGAFVCNIAYKRKIVKNIIYTNELMNIQNK